MSKLPEDLTIKILVRLPVKSISRFRCVCKQWLKLFSDHNFIKLHFDIATENENLRLMVSGENMFSMMLDSTLHKVNPLQDICHKVIVEIDYPFKSSDHDVMAVMGSCNGLLCIVSNEQTFCIWNPSTGMYKKIPSSFHIELLSHYQLICGFKFGFGYDFHNKEYKFLIILDIGNNHSVAQVYSEGTNSWKPNQLLSYSFAFGNMSGVIVSENLHWIVKHYSRSETRSLVLSFSISDESFQELPLPENVNDSLYVMVGALDGDLCITDYCAGMFSVDVWVMKDYGVDGSWSKLLVIPLPTTMPLPSMVGVKLLHSFKNGEILLWRDNHTLLLYHPKYNESRIVVIGGLPDGLYEIMTFAGSLYSVNSGKCLEQNRIESVATEQRTNLGNKIKNFFTGLMSIFKCFSGMCVGYFQKDAFLYAAIEGSEGRNPSMM
ncbi:F-box/kelch-repeat protein At3g06240-like [Papaver somniferum]|uniref:F-box/kelch-repeat protein At3g06240-like n=1 Tax=Papaver somniferum TaxID=3469 RepID=UPI000E703A2E|nr:F-box/kelch-repeat protein At3g06240-like [Papaver somniferum]